MTEPDMTELSLAVFVPTSKVVAVIDGIARQNGWTETVEDANGDIIPNPKTKAQWVKDWIRDVIQASWKAFKDSQAVADALAAQAEDGSDFE